MKLLAAVLTISALGLSGANAATLDLVGTFNPSGLLGPLAGNNHHVVPEPSTWALMILGFALLALRVRAMRRALA